MSADKRIFRARWIVPIGGPSVENGTIEIEAGCVAAVHGADDLRAVDLGNVAIIPGLVNAHTHLEFSDLETPLQPAQPFTDWIRALLAWRDSRPADVSASITRGLSESAASGTTSLGEIATEDWSAEQLEPAGPRVTVFRELIGLLPGQTEEQLALARRHLQLTPDKGEAESNIKRGLSPHAPYSVHPDLYGRLVELAAEFRAPLAVHLAETRAELELLANRTGAFRQMLSQFGLWRDDVIPQGSRPLDYLRPLEKLERALIVHGNYLSADEITFVAERPNLAVVYCPRTHAFFGHADHPWRELQRRGALVALGTDSRASNPDLSVWNELCFLHGRFADVDPLTLLQMGTVNGARALGDEARAQGLTPGAPADLAVVSLPETSGNELASLFDRGSRVTATMRAGRWIGRAAGSDFADNT